MYIIKKVNEADTALLADSARSNGEPENVQSLNDSPTQEPIEYQWLWRLARKSGYVYCLKQKPSI